MPSDQLSLLLLSDAIDRVIANPTAGHCWLNLMAQARAVTRVELLDEAARLLAAAVPDQGLPGYYLAAFLDMATGDARHVAQAVACLGQIAPRDLDRHLAFFHVACQRAFLYAPDRATFRRRLLQGDLAALAAAIAADVARLLPLPRRRARPRSGEVARVAIVAPLLTQVQHPPTLMALNQAEVLMREGVAVRLFTCQESHIPEQLALVGTGASIPGDAMQLDRWSEESGSGVVIHGADARFSILRRYRDMLQAIDAFDADVVLLVGLHSGLADALYAQYPVLGLCSNSIAPLAATDVWLTAHAALDGVVDQPWDGAFPASLAWHHPYRVRRKPLKHAFSRASLGLADDALVLISVGSQLDQHIAGAWAARMAALVQERASLTWLLVGGGGAMPAALAQLPADRLRVLAYVPEGWEITACCDVYVNPPVMGGGFAVAEAMSLGVPVVSFAGSDGGDKVAARAVDGIDAYFARLTALLDDGALRRREGDAMRAHFDAALDLAHSGPGLLEACAQAVARYALRVNSA